MGNREETEIIGLLDDVYEIETIPLYEIVSEVETSGYICCTKL